MIIPVYPYTFLQLIRKVLLVQAHLKASFPMFPITLISYVYHVLFILGVSWREGPWEIKEAAGAGGQVHQVHSKLRRFKRKDFKV